MITWLVIGLAIVLAVIVLVAIQLGSGPSASLDKAYFEERWTAVTRFAASPETPQMAVIEADKLLDEALKRRSFKGATMGERMVSAQAKLSNNNAAWNAHKLRNRLVHEQNVRLRDNEIDQALRGFKQALKDLGAL